ncbi:MAG TPA: hypothetical protein VG455_11810 [Acidimicrobiales bacterium]|nr:hypothetical protein [Acidimicrobiales bacterium]
MGPTRRPDTSTMQATGPYAGRWPGARVDAMKKLLIIAVLVALGVFAAKKVRAI